MPNRVPSQTPTFYDDLDASLAEAWRLLVGGIADRRAPIHTIAVATINRYDRPSVRTVVLRDADASARVLRFNTDSRSEKLVDLQANSFVEVLAYDPSAKIQLRLTGRAAVHKGDATAHAAWAQAQAQSRLCYRQAAAPGATTDDPLASAALIPNDGFEHFSVVLVHVEALDWLYLASAGHRRARFTWDAAGALTKTWCAV